MMYHFAKRAYFEKTYCAYAVFRIRNKMSKLLLYNDVSIESLLQQLKLTIYFKYLQVAKKTEMMMITQYFS